MRIGNLDCGIVGCPSCGPAKEYYGKSKCYDLNDNEEFVKCYAIKNNGELFRLDEEIISKHSDWEEPVYYKRAKTIAEQLENKSDYIALIKISKINDKLKLVITDIKNAIRN